MSTKTQKYTLEDFLWELGLTVKVALEDLVYQGKTMAVCPHGCEVGVEEYCKHGNPSLVIAMREKVERLEESK